LGNLVNCVQVAFAAIGFSCLRNDHHLWWFDKYYKLKINSKYSFFNTFSHSI
jgi:hypothetical protein